MTSSVELSSYKPVDVDNDDGEATSEKLSIRCDNKSEESTLEVVTSCRWTLSYIGCICFTLLYALRINMSIAMVCMVKNTQVSANTSVVTSQCAAYSGNNTSHQVNQVDGDIEWDKPTQGWILSSFFYGYILTQIPGGYLSGRFGGKRVMLGGMALYGISTLVLPFAARYDGKDFQTSAYLVIALRVIAGLATGVVFPAMHNLWGKWARPYERSKLNVLCFSGTMIGNVLMLGVGGFLCEWREFDGGWPSMFYIGGGLCLLFCILWAFTVYDSPNEHPRITEMERDYIVQSQSHNKLTRNDYVPWRQIMTSPAMWAIIVAHCSNNFGNYTLITKLPAFMKEVLYFDIKSNGLYSTLPYMAMFIVANAVSHIVDKLREKNITTTATARKIAMILALVIPASILVATGHIPCQLNYLGVVSLTVAVGFTGFNRSGYSVNPQDIGAKYAGEIFGISNTFATVPGMVAPLLVNYMTVDGTQLQWQVVFYVWAGVFCFGAVFYLIFAKGDTQAWAKDEDNE